MKTKKMEQLFDNITKGKNIQEAILFTEKMDGSESWHKGYGGRALDSPMVAASITKLVTSACIYILHEQGKLKLDDPINRHLEGRITSNLHMMKRYDYSSEITIRHLLHQTSGLPDFYLDGKMFRRVLQQDYAYSFEDILEQTKKMPAHFVPGTGKKAYYSDLNFDLLGQVIDRVTGLSYAEAAEKLVFAPLEMDNSYIATAGNSRNLPSLYHRDHRLERPKFLASSYASGGLITTAADLMKLLRGFFAGSLFDTMVLEQYSNHKALQMAFYPIHYSNGFMRIEAGYPFGEKKLLVGHSGSTGSFAFYDCADNRLFIGDFAQMASPSLPVRTAIRLAL